MEIEQTHERNLLDPAVLSRIGGLELRARLIVEGYFSGLHHSPRHGVSVEFADHRAYTQGDDLRHIDWKVFAKTDKYYIKEYERETNLSLMVVIDASESMSYRSTHAPMSKYDYASSAVAAVAFLALQQQDSVGIARFDESVGTFLRPSNRGQQWHLIAKELSSGTGRNKTSIGPVLLEIAERTPQNMLILIASDFFDDVDTILQGLRRLRYRGHELIVWNVWDPAELTLPFESATMFKGLEAAGNLLADPRRLRERYRAEVASFQANMRAGCSHLHADYLTLNTAAPLDTALSGYLTSRSARLRRRSARVMGGG